MSKHTVMGREEREKDGKGEGRGGEGTGEERREEERRERAKPL